MKLKISNLIVPVATKEPLLSIIAKQYHINEKDILQIKILHSAIDARKRDKIVYNYQVMIETVGEAPQLLKKANITRYEEPKPLEYPQWNHGHAPVIVGFGPAGMFSALFLARCHAKPVIIERGSQIEQRKKEVTTFLTEKKLNPDSNIQFGEGGAGTFSDGKLNTNLHNEWIRFVLEEFYHHGASEEVLYDAAPHVGTDYLEIVVRNIREEIIKLGGQFHFNTTFTDYKKENTLITVQCNNNTVIETNHLLLCLGHSARDTIRHLYDKGLKMEAKSFSMGVRIEHLQTKIDQMQYGKQAHLLPAASYKGAVHIGNRSAYTFCMCPGGTVMASADEDKTIVTNGMSEKKRDKSNSNAALLVNVTPDDFVGSSPLDGMDYQEKYEKKAFAISNDYRAPCNLLHEFCNGTVAEKHRSIIPSYPHGVVYCDFNRCLPPFVVDTLRKSIPLFEHKLHGFCDPDAVLTGIETRSSSPIRILRNVESRESNIAGIYPVGEGAGYAGGIVSAAIDGLRTAASLLQKMQ